MQLINANNLQGFTIHAIDGELGSADDLYFDDESWTIRYLTVKTGGWLNDRSVLISPISIIDVDWDAERVNVSLTKDQVKNSPDIDTDKPVSRQHESVYLGYYGYPSYWDGPYLWGAGYTPYQLAIPVSGYAGERPKGGPFGDSHLRSIKAVEGYKINATDGELGHVKGFVIDDVTWSIRYMEVSTSNWWPAKKILIAPAWIERLTWIDEDIFVGLTRDLIQSGPEYVEAEPITREYEEQLYRHYAKFCYWPNERETAAYSISGGL